MSLSPNPGHYTFGLKGGRGISMGTSRHRDHNGSTLERACEHLTPQRMGREMKTRETLFRFIEKTKQIADEAPFLTSFLIVLLLMTGELVFFVPYFLTNDDIDGLMIAKGVGFALQPDEHLFFSNVLLGLLLKKCYLLFPRPSWYGYGQVLGQFLAFWALLSSFVLRSRRLFSAVLFGISFLLVSLYFFFQLNFTILSILTFQGGILLLSNLWEKDREPFQAKTLLLGGSCLLLSSLIRWEGFLFAALTAAPFIAGTAWSNRKKPGKFWWIFPILLLVLGSAGFDHYYYGRDVRWGEFSRDYHSTIPYFVFGHFEYDNQTKDYFNSVGWTRNDFNLFKSFYLLDQDKYGPEVIKKLGRIFPLYGFQGWKGSLCSFLAQFHLTSPITKRNYLIYLTTQNILLCLVVFPFFCPPARIRWIFINALWVLSLVFFLVSLGRAPERVFLPGFFFLVSLTTYYAVPPAPRTGAKVRPISGFAAKWGKVLLIFLLLLSPATVYRFYDLNLQYQEREIYFKSFLNSLHPRPDQLYVVWAGHFPYETINALDDFEFFRNFHLFNLSCFERSPLSQDMLARFGIQNLFRDIVDRPYRFLICHPDHLNYFKKYLEEREGWKVREEEDFPNDFFHIYRIHLLQKGGG